MIETFFVVLAASLLSSSVLYILLKPKLANQPVSTGSAASPAQAKAVGSILVDTSAIIDGRIADVAQAGFMPGRLLVPRFVLQELQNIADSEDPQRRMRGRRGLEVLNALRQTADVEIEVVEENPEDIKEVDHKLVYLAKQYDTDILTTDYNLNRVASVESVRVLNVNELSNALRAVVLPGEILEIKVAQQGKERGQGVGYLEDGTMIVVEDGEKLIGKDVKVEVSKIFQSVAGKMIFASQKNGNGSNHSSQPKRTTQSNNRTHHRPHQQRPRQQSK
jgi:uncharacterized protein YacL